MFVSVSQNPNIEQQLPGYRLTFCSYYREKKYLVPCEVIQFDLLQEAPRKWYTAVPICNLVHAPWPVKATVLLTSAGSWIGWEAACGFNPAGLESPTGQGRRVGVCWTEVLWRGFANVMDFVLQVQSWSGRRGSRRVWIRVSFPVPGFDVAAILKEIQRLCKPVLWNEGHTMKGWIDIPLNLVNDFLWWTYNFDVVFWPLDWCVLHEAP